MSTHTPTTPPLRIVLTGFMGSGKSTVGKQLAQRLGWRFFDADQAIESEAGITIAQIFAQQGEAAFRAQEEATILRIAQEPEVVLALGGGAIESEATRQFLLTAPETLLIHLEVSLQTTLQRCRGTEQSRPVLADQARLQARYQSRLPLYQQAHLSLAVDHLRPRQVVDAIVDAAGLITHVNSNGH